MSVQRFPSALVLASSALIFSGFSFLGETDTNPLVTGLIIIQALSLIISPSYPRISTITYLTAFIGALLAGHSTGLEIFLGVILVIAIVAAGHYCFSLLIAVIITIGGFYSPANAHFEFDIVALLIFFLITAMAYLLGFWIHREYQQNQLTQRAQKEHRKQLTSLLHDTIAADLTSLVVQLEKLAIATPALHNSLKDTAHTARSALEHTQQLLNALDTHSSKQHPPSFPKILESLTQRLRNHGFTVTTSTKMHTPVSIASHNTALERVLSEIITNIIKHATPHSLITIDTVSNDQGVTLTIANPYSVREKEKSSSTGLGLASMSQTLHAVGGTLTTTNNEHQWVTIAHVPFYGI